MQKKGSPYIKPDMPVAEAKKKVRRSSALSAETPGRKRSTAKASGAAKKSSAGSRVKPKAIKTVPGSALPEQYGDNHFFLIVVDPYVVYASWEIRRKDMPRRGGAKMRLFDVTGIESSGDRDGKFFEIALLDRVGSGFFEVRMAGREAIAEIGHVRDGRFVPILRSHRVSFPLPFSSGEPGIQGEPGQDTPIGY